MCEGVRNGRGDYERPGDPPYGFKTLDDERNGENMEYMVAESVIQKIVLYFSGNVSKEELKGRGNTVLDIPWGTMSIYHPENPLTQVLSEI